MTPVYLGRPSRREGPEYSSVLVPIDDECDPPPPYPGTEDLPPPYWSIFPPKESELPGANLPVVITSGDFCSGGIGNNNGHTAVPIGGAANSAIISHHSLRQHRDRSRRRGRSNETSENGEPRRRPFGPRVVACFDIVLNCPFLLLFFLDLKERRRISALQLIIFMYNLVWIHAAFQLYRSTDLRLPSLERKKLTEGWEKINNILLFVLGLLTTFSIYSVVALLHELRNIVVGLVIVTVPFGIRLIFFNIIGDYILSI